MLNMLYCKASVVKTSGEGRDRDRKTKSIHDTYVRLVLSQR